MKLLYLFLAFLGVFGVHSSLKKRDEETAVGHKIYGNVALLDENGNLVKASCGMPDRYGKLTHGRTQWIDNRQMCVDWNAGTEGNDAVTLPCGEKSMICCDEDQLLEETYAYDGTLQCTYDVPMCVEHETETYGYMTLEPIQCHFGDGRVTTCGNGVHCCDEGYNNVYWNGWSYQCNNLPREPQPERPEYVPETIHYDIACNANFVDNEGSDCAEYVDLEFCDELYYDDYTNSDGETARVCPGCGVCTESVQLFSAVSQMQNIPSVVVYGFAMIGVLGLSVGAKNVLTRKMDYQTVNDPTDV